MTNNFNHFLQYKKEHPDANPAIISKVRNACILADTVVDTLKPVYLVNFTPVQVVYSLTPIEGAVEGRLIRDSSFKRMVISDGRQIFAYNMNSIKKIPGRPEKDTNILTAKGSRREKYVSSENYDLTGNIMNRDARDELHIYPKEMEQIDCGTNTRDKSIAVKKYWMQLLMWNENALNQWLNIIKSDAVESLVVNHMNNDCRDNSYNNLEITTIALNNMHAAIVKEIARLYPDYTYEYVVWNGHAYKIHVAIRFRLSVGKASIINNTMDAIIKSLLNDLCEVQVS